MKTKTIKVAHFPQFREYVVQQITDSTDYNPGQSLTKNEVDALCNNGAWKVTIVAGKR